MSRRTVLVTGCSRGIGRATCLRLAGAGTRVLAGVRRAEDGAAIEREAPGEVHGLVLDLASASSIARAAQRVEEVVGVDGLHALVNNAAAPGDAVPLEHVSLEDLERSFAVTAVGTLLLTRSLLPWVRRARGRIVNVGAGRIAMPLLGPAFCAKFAIEAMSDLLRLELRGVGVGVSVVEPGMTRWDDVDEQLEAYDRDLEAGLRRVPPHDRSRYERAVRHFQQLNRRMMKTAWPADRVARVIQRAIESDRPRARYYCGWEQRVASWMQRLTTERLRDAVVARMTGL